MLSFEETYEGLEENWTPPLLENGLTEQIIEEPLDSTFMLMQCGVVMQDN